jgi:hypothetical protein
MGLIYDCGINSYWLIRSANVVTCCVICSLDRFWYFMLKIILSFSSVSSRARVVRRRPIFRELLSMACYLEDYRTRVFTWAARTS